MKRADKLSRYDKKTTSGYFSILSDIKNHSGNYSWDRKEQLENYKVSHSEGISMEEEVRIEVNPPYYYSFGI
jgi:hypothetical protein